MLYSLTMVVMSHAWPHLATSARGHAQGYLSLCFSGALCQTSNCESQTQSNTSADCQRATFSCPIRSKSIGLHLKKIKYCKKQKQNKTN